MASKTACLYRHFDKNGALLYIGESLRGFERTMQHFHSAAWIKRVAKTTWEWHPSKAEARIAERLAIKAEMPLYNIKHSVRPLPPPKPPRQKIVKIKKVVPLDGITSAMPRVKDDRLTGIKRFMELQSTRQLISP